MGFPWAVSGAEPAVGAIWMGGALSGQIALLELLVCPNRKKGSCDKEEAATAKPVADGSVCFGMVQ